MVLVEMISGNKVYVSGDMGNFTTKLKWAGSFVEVTAIELENDPDAGYTTLTQKRKTKNLMVRNIESFEEMDDWNFTKN